MKMKHCRFAVAALSGLFFAVNSGSAQTWTVTSAPLTNWTAIASSADGTKLVATVAYYNGFPNDLGLIYTSTNSGATWILRKQINEFLISVVSSSDGQKIFALDQYGGLSASTNSGSTWKVTTGPGGFWRSLVCSADGTRLAALGSSSGDRIYTSTNSGTSWMPASAPNTNGWRGLA